MGSNKAVLHKCLKPDNRSANTRGYSFSSAFFMSDKLPTSAFPNLSHHKLGLLVCSVTPALPCSWPLGSAGLFIPKAYWTLQLTWFDHRAQLWRRALAQEAGPWIPGQVLLGSVIGILNQSLPQD